MHKISFVIPVLSYKPLLQKTVDAIHGAAGLRKMQYEILVIQNGPKKAIPAWLVSDAHVSCLYLPEASIPLARNTGLEKSQFDLIAFLDEDSVCGPEWLEEALSFLEKPNVGGYQSPSYIRQEVVRLEEFYTKWKEFMGIVYFDTGASLFKREAVIDAGGFDESFRRVEDFDLAMRLVRRGWILAYGSHVVGGSDEPDRWKFLRDRCSSIYYLKRLYQKYNLPWELKLFPKNFKPFRKKSRSQGLWLKLAHYFIRPKAVGAFSEKPRSRFITFFTEENKTSLIKARYHVLLTTDTLIFLVGNYTVLTTRDKYLYDLYLYSGKEIHVDLDQVQDREFVNELRTILWQPQTT